MASLQAIPRPNPCFTIRDIGDETIFLSEKGDMLHTLNAVGTFIWRNIDGKKSIRDILGLLLEEYEVPEPAARGDILRFFEELGEKNLVQWEENT